MPVPAALLFGQIGLSGAAGALRIDAADEEAKALEPTLRASEMELGGLDPAMGLFGALGSEDIAKYQAAMQGYSAELSKPKKNLGGLGSALGIGAGLLLAAPTGGLSLLAGGALGGIVAISAPSNALFNMCFGFLMLATIIAVLKL